MKPLSMKKILYLCSLLLTGSLMHAAKPGWTVNPGLFQYSMNVTAVLNVDCSELSNDSNLLGAFVNGVCRGVVKTNNTVGGRKLAYLLVYSNVGSGETVIFKLYDATADSVCTSKVSLAFADNATYGSNNLPWIVKNNDPPSSISLSASSVMESLAIGQNVANISCVDPDIADTHVYTLVPGTGSADNAKFLIAGASLNLNAVLNSYIQDSLHLRIRSTDNRGCYYEKAFVIFVSHVNHPPYAIHLSDSTVFDHKPLNTFVAKLSALDPDQNESFSYALTAGIGDTNNVNFSISADTLYTASSFDSLIKASYTVRIRVYDGAHAYCERPVRIHIKDSPDGPTNISLSANTVFDNMPAGTFIGKLSTTDDIGTAFTYSFSSSGINDNSSFAISHDSLWSAAIVHFETKSNYIVQIASTNSVGLSFSKAFSVQVLDRIDTVTAVLIYDSIAWDKKPLHTFIGLVSAISTDPTETYTFSLAAGVGDTNNVSFKIIQDSLFAEISFQAEIKSKYTIRVRATDVDGAILERPVTIFVLDTPDPPAGIKLSDNRIYEDLPVQTFIAKLSTSDDIGHAFTYTFSNTGTNDNTNFTISNDTLKSNAIFDFEIKNLYSILITSTDSLNQSLTKTFAIIVRDTLDTPTDMAIDNALILENRPVHTQVGVLSTRDDNGPNATHVYSLVIGPGSIDNGNFAISGDTLFSNARFDFETKNAYQVRIRTTLANNLYLDKAFTVNIIEGADTIQNILISNDSVYENSSAIIVIGQLKAVGQDTTDKYTYAFDNSVASDNTSFSLTSTGQLSAAQVFDYDVKSRYLISVQASNVGGTSFIKQLTIKIRDTLDVPTDIHLSDSLVADNKAGHTFIGRFSTTDENGALAQHIYSLVPGAGGADDSSFLIGHDSLYTKNLADFEAQAFYHIRVRSSLINGMFTEKPFQVHVLNNAGRPFANNDSISILENAQPEYLITPLVTDSDTYATLTYLLLSTNMPFTMDAATGRLSLTGPLNYQIQSRYVLSYRVSDDASPAKHDSATIIVTVLPVVEAILPINNYVSPNGDGKNDYLVIQNPDVYKAYELTLYNSNGMVVLKTKAYDNTWNGTGLDAGIYYYTFIGPTKYKGNITLVK
jgi:gliding motility-associated-like protein